MGRAGKTILLVEDDAIVGLMEKAVLGQEGYDVVHVTSGEAALEAFAPGLPPPDLVLMDLNLGDGMDGTEAARRILALRDLPVVFLSSHTEAEVVERTEGIGGYGYIVKDSGPTVLFTSIRMAFRLHEARTRLVESEASLRRAQVLAGIGFWELDLASGRLRASEGAVGLYGLPSPEDFFPQVQRVPLPEYRGLLDQALADLLAGTRPYDVEFRIRRPSDGAVRDIHSVAEHDRAEGRVFGVIRDITEYRLESAKRVESEAHFRFLFQNSAVSLLEEDFSGAKARLDELCGRLGGAGALEAHLLRHPEEVADLVGRITLLNVNAAYAALLGITLDSRRIGSPVTSLPTADLDRFRREFVALAGGATEFTDDFRMAVPDGGELSLQLRLVIPREHVGDWSRVFITFIDLTRERAQERRLEVLMRELEHRVKNSMGLISSLFDLESERLTDPEARQVFLDARERVATVSAIYDLLSRSQGAEWLDSATQLEELLHLITETYVTPGSGFTLAAEVESHRIATKQAVSISLIVNELVTNALKYAYPPGQGGPIRVGFRRAGADFAITVADRGRGLDPGSDTAKPGHLGFRLVELLAQQHGGSMELRSGGGLRVEVLLPAASSP